jgi:hypothetical protein
MLGSTGSTGQVALSMGRIAIGAASSQVTTDLRRLMAGGWLRIVRNFDPIEMTPTLYALTFPSEETDMSGPRSGAPLPGVETAAMLLLGREWLRRLRAGDWEGCLGGHDAFRRAKGTLNAAYPILTLLTDAPISVELLASWLRMPERRVRDHAQDLVRAGLARLTTNGYIRTQADLTAALDRVALDADRHGARQPGKPPISGTRARAIKEYRERTEERIRYLEDHEVPGTEAWREEQAKNFRTTLKGPSGASLLRVWSETGRSQEELVEEVVGDYFLQFEQTRAVMGEWFSHGHCA